MGSKVLRSEFRVEQRTAEQQNNEQQPATSSAESNSKIPPALFRKRGIPGGFASLSLFY
jgi:hypothetical protein